MQAVLILVIAFSYYLWTSRLDFSFEGKTFSWEENRIEQPINNLLKKRQLQNLNQTSASWLNLNFKILTEFSFRISTKIQLHNLYKISAAKY